MTDYKEIGEKIVEAIAHFEKNLVANTQFRHLDTHAHGGTIEHFAKSIIDAEFSDTQATVVNNVTNLVRELQELKNK